MYATTESTELLRPTRDADRGSFGKRVVSTVAIALGIACVALAVYAPDRIGLGYVLNYGTNGAPSTIDSTLPPGSNCSTAWCVRARVASRRVGSPRGVTGVGNRYFQRRLTRLNSECHDALLSIRGVESEKH